MNRLCLVTLIGLPAAGKSTFCKHLIEMESLPFNIIHLSYDNLITFNAEIPSKYKEQREVLLKSIKAIIQKLKKTKNLSIDLQPFEIHCKNYQRNDVIILCDDNHYYRSMRYKLFQLAREQSLGYCQIYFKCALELALKRNSLRNNPEKVPIDVIMHMHNRLEVPNTIDNNWEKNTLFLENSYLCEGNYIEIIFYIEQFLNKPLHSLQIDVPKSSQLQSKAHELDLMIRKRIKELTNAEQRQEKKILSKKLNDKRKEILKIFQGNMKEKLQGDLNLDIYIEMMA